MFGPGMIEAMNSAGIVQDLLDKYEAQGLLYTADEIASTVACEHGWWQDEDGEWRDEEGDGVDYPLDMLLQYNLPRTMAEEIVDRIVDVANEYRKEQEADNA